MLHHFHVRLSTNSVLTSKFRYRLLSLVLQSSTAMSIVLPPEIWISIMGCLDYHSLHNMRRVNKFCHGIIEGSAFDRALFRNQPYHGPDYYHNLQHPISFEIHPLLSDLTKVVSRICYGVEGVTIQHREQYQLGWHRHAEYLKAVGAEQQNSLAQSPYQWWRDWRDINIPCLSLEAATIPPWPHHFAIEVVNVAMSRGESGQDNYGHFLTVNCVLDIICNTIDHWIGKLEPKRYLVGFSAEMSQNPPMLVLKPRYSESLDEYPNLCYERYKRYLEA